MRIILSTNLLHLRLRWYAVSTARLLLRRWQALLLAAGVLAPSGASLFGNIHALAWPVLQVLAPAHGVAWRFGYLLLLLAFATLWALMQREQIGGGAFMRFAAALPIAPRDARLVDLAVLALADSPLWAPLGAALLASGLDPAAALAQRAANLLLVLDCALFALLAQLAALERRRMAWLAVAALGLIVVAAAAGPHQLAACLACGAAAGWLLARPLPRGSARLCSAARDALAPLGAAARASLERLPPALLIALDVLYRQRRSEMIGKALGAGVIALAALGMMRAWDFDRRAFPLALIGQAVTALTVSGLYRGLHMAHGAAAPYFDALPLPRHWRRRSDAIVVVALGLPFFALIGGAVLAHRAAPPGAVLASVLSAAALLCALRAPQLYRARHAVFLSALGAAVWTALTLALLL